jgi:beta-lactam-binding protein with PASTA domain
LSKKAASAKLTAAGFTVKAEDLLPIIQLNKVYSQSIAAGTMAPKGSLVVLKIV